MKERREGIIIYRDINDVVYEASITKFTYEIKSELQKYKLQKLGISANKMLSVVVTSEEHAIFTDAWRKEFSYGIDYGKIGLDQLWAAAQKIYADYPELLDAAKKTLLGE